MAKFKCIKCDKEITLLKHTIKVEDESIVSPEAVCCGGYMQSIKENKGFGCAMVGKGGKVRGKF
tara:strand:+ start:1053 stop:1244 length:192 start_codon:yes stop_codon:yes gene_type:complete